ncbi:succinic semialdehyde dehydrogenase [Kitasatospora sp. NPDC048296]|uniref:succinic semialdehyde dehydrogenase n=1 Tax=Kitasatospora sp. NPDC048296 TaxID=3364048 RepID=UPI003723E6B4
MQRNVALRSGESPGASGADFGREHLGVRVSDVRVHPTEPFRFREISRRVVSSGAEQEIDTPFTGEPLASVPISGKADVARAYEAARAAQLTWAQTRPEQRAKPFLKFVDLLMERRSELLDIIQLETGKARRHAYEELLDVALCALYYARRAPRWLRPVRRQGVVPVATRVREARRPKGVVGMITPWNYPVSMGVTDVVPALLAGNAVVHKPDTQTSLGVLWCVDLLQKCGLPEGLWQVVLGEPAEIGDVLIDQADYVAFTGSTAAGRAIAARVAPRLVSCSLELGGKNAMIVCRDADVERAVRGAVRACFANAGQLCISIERLYVHESIHDRFLRRFAEATRAMRLGIEFSFDVDMGSLTFRRQLDLVTRHVEQAVARGATVVVGGRARPDIGPLFYEPTILTGVTAEMDLCATETFGPVVSVQPFTEEAQAVELANDSSYGLNASVWTRDLARGERLAARIRAGSVNINEGYAASMASHDVPMGGMKDSGVGRRHGREGLFKYTEVQALVSQRYLDLAPLGAMSYQSYAELLSASVVLMKRLRIR